MASLLREHGYEAFALAGGLAAWRAAGYPLEPRGLDVPVMLEGLCSACGCPADDHVGASTDGVAPI